MVVQREKKAAPRDHMQQQQQQEPVKRPGSAVSREFQPQRQQKANSIWRKQQQEKPQQQAQQQQQQQQMYGFVPFKAGGAANPAGPSIYGTAIRPPHPPNDYLHSIYAPPQVARQQRLDSSSSNVPAANVPSAKPGSRPGSDMGMYKILPSRCQSYTTLPRPEHGGPELLPDGGGAFAMSKANGGFWAPPRDNVSLSQIPFRPPSSLSRPRSLGRKNSTSLPPAYFGAPQLPGAHIEFGEPSEAEARDELASWSTISLASWLTIVFGSAIFCLSAVRLYWRADIAKGGQELFYGISAICAGIVGVLASQNRNYCMLVAAFLHFAVNAVFFVPFIAGILPLFPLLQSVSGGKQAQQPLTLGVGKANNNNELPVVDAGLAMLSLLQLAAAFSLLLYGCRAFGRTMRGVEAIQRGMAMAQRDEGQKEKQ